MKLQGEAKQMFDSIVKMKGLKEEDGLVELKMGCYYYGKWCELVEQDVEVGNYDGVGKVQRMSPGARRLKECWQIWSKVSEKYGLTPLDARKLVDGNKPNAKKKGGGKRVSLRLEKSKEA